METPKSPIRLNAGCGLAYRPDFINFDLRPGDARADVAADLLALPFAPGVADQVVLSHVLEHVGKHDVLSALLEARRALRVGGTVAIEVPDLEHCVRLWLNTPEPQRWGFPADAIYGEQWHPGQFHRTGFTRTRLLVLVDRAGLIVEQASAGESHGVEVIRMLARRPQAFESRSDLEPTVRLEKDCQLGRGWWALERGEGGRFRWTAGEAVAFLRAPQRGFSRLRLRGHAATEHLSARELTVGLRCDGSAVAEKTTPSSGPIAFEGQVPQSCAQEEFHVVRVTVSPAFYAPGDERQLGIIVHELSLCE